MASAARPRSSGCTVSSQMSCELRSGLPAKAARGRPQAFSNAGLRYAARRVAASRIQSTSVECSANWRNNSWLPRSASSTSRCAWLSLAMPIQPVIRPASSRSGSLRVRNQR